MIRSKRHPLLIAAICALAVGDLFYFAAFKGNDQELPAEWVAYMPSLEGSQRSNPVALLNSSDWVDPRWPKLFVNEKEGFGLPLFPKIASDCKVPSYTLRTHLGPNDTDPAQMPDRFFTGALNAEQQRCLRRQLPHGYVLARLLRPRLASAITWSEGDLRLSSEDR